MTFYLRPPSGTTHFHSLEKSAITRLNFLIQLDLTSGDPVKVHDLLTDISLVEESDCLIEGTRKDRISHYILRLAFAGNPELSKFLLRAERLFFEVRFLTMESKAITKLLYSLDVLLMEFDSKLNRHTRRMMNSDNFCLSEILGTFLKLWQQFGSWQSVVEKYFSGCQTDFMEIPFAYVLDLVKNRSVTLTHGMASLPVAKLRLVAMALFETLLKSGLLQAQKRFDVVKDDIRMRRLFTKLQSLYREKQGSASNGCHVRRQLNHTKVEDELSSFPPCMSHLHRQLRQKHRLKHHSRIQYTLFLKEIGLPVHEAIMFWKKEYSLMSEDNKTCSHTWLQEEQRYTYSIRHLYGLEGSRVNYKGHCCQSLQGREFGHQEEGGCPFVRFDNSHMSNFLQLENIVSAYQDKILKSAAKGDYQEACQTFLVCKHQQKSKSAEERILIDQNKSSDGFHEQKLQEDISMDIDVKQRFLHKTLDDLDVLHKTLDDLDVQRNVSKREPSLKFERELSYKTFCGLDYSEHFCQKELELAPCLEVRKNMEKIKSFPCPANSIVDCSKIAPQTLTNLNGLSENNKSSKVTNMTFQASSNLIQNDLKINKPLDFYNSLKLLEDQ